MDSIDQIESDIKTLKIQGATNVALAVIDALEQTPQNERERVGKRLAYARPTEPLAQNILRYDKKLSDYKALMVNAKNSITRHGISIIKDGATYLTHCHASTVTDIFLASNKNIHIYATETRPLFQGRRTAYELIDGGLKNVTMLVDSAAATVLDQKNIAAVFIGADLLTETGFANKIGSLAISQLAALKNIPVYCFSTLLKYNPRSITLEQRDPKEIWATPPKKLQFFTPAFDFVPYSDNIKIICEQGVIQGTIVKDTVKNTYPFIFNG